MTNKDLIKKFYQSFADGNAKGMADCYDEHIIFEDPAFGVLKGAEVKAMWTMLLSKSTVPPSIKFYDIEADDKTGKAYWIANYTYGLNKRPVENKIHATFKFANGKITHHKDHFNLWKWTQQALGLSGYLLGWSSFMKSKIQQQTNRALQKFMQQ